VTAQPKKVDTSDPKKKWVESLHDKFQLKFKVYEGFI
jgi:hypothetical protein